MARHHHTPARVTSSPGVRVAVPDTGDLHELLTVEEVAALLKVSRTWVYEHTRARGMARTERLPSIKIGKYTRFDPLAIRQFLLRRSTIA